MLYCAFVDFEECLKDEAPGFEYEKGTIVFGAKGKDFSPEWKKYIKREKSTTCFKLVTEARHWMFHHTSETLPWALDSVLDAMARILVGLKGISSQITQPPEDDVPDLKVPSGSFPDWAACVCASKKDPARRAVTVSLRLSATRMSIPIPVVKTLVGREADIETLAGLLVDSKQRPQWGARLVVSGLPGVGKDTVAAAVVRSAAVSQNPAFRLQVWLQGSTDTLFETQLLQVRGLCAAVRVSRVWGFLALTLCCLCANV